jgi:DNA-binding FadR family transcriptional regulator
VETKAGRGAVIVARSPVPLPQSGVTDVFQKWAVLDLLEVRESLEGQAAALAAQRATALDLATIERFCARDRAAGHRAAHVLPRECGVPRVQINGVGPFDVTYVDPKDDPRNK